MCRPSKRAIAANQADTDVRRCLWQQFCGSIAEAALIEDEEVEPREVWCDQGELLRNGACGRRSAAVTASRAASTSRSTSALWSRRRARSRPATTKVDPKSWDGSDVSDITRSVAVGCTMGSILAQATDPKLTASSEGSKSLLSHGSVACPTQAGIASSDLVMKHSSAKNHPPRRHPTSHDGCSQALARPPRS